MSRITEAAVDWLQKSGRCRIHLRTAVLSADRHGSGWRLAFNGRPPADFAAVIFAVPARRAADMLPALDFAALRTALRQIEFASSAIVISVHRLNEASHPLDASGLVVPVIEKRSIVAVSFSSRKFAGRAPDDRIVLRTFVGGALQPELLNHDDDGLVALVLRELESLFGLRSAPLLTRVARYSDAMPQYHVGHLERVTQIEQLVAALPGLELAGNSLHGVGIPDAIASGRAAADRLLQQMTNDR
jgi:oxygen-dependent protoporphyrinogen oxidase